ncbi:MAG: ATP-dependent helicase HrpB [Bilophila wadsworthia]
MLGEKVGQTVGYRVRLDSRVSASTRITVVTEGVLTRMLQDDPDLQGVGCLIFDEFHERSLNADLGLALAIDCQQGLRDDLRLLIMSATLDSGPLLKLLQQDFSGAVPVLRSEGRAWPVETHHLPLPRADIPMERWVADAVRRALREENGSILVFLPGTGEIRKVEALLQDVRSDTVHLCPLYGELPAAEQDAAIAPVWAPVRKIVLATSIAETSLTIEGVRVVIDSGLARTVRFDAERACPGLSRSAYPSPVPSSVGAGQGGRSRAYVTGCGIKGTKREWRPISDRKYWMPTWPRCALSLPYGDHRPFFPALAGRAPGEAVNQAIPLLRSLEAVDAAGRVTARGRVMARLPLHPRLAHMVLAAKAFGLGKAACLLAAMADERDPLRLRDVDIRPRLALLGNGQGSPAVFRIREAAHQIGRLVDAAGEPPHRTPMSIPEEEQAGVLLALAYPDRLAQKRSRGSYRMANGRGGFLDDTDSLADEPVLAVGAVNGGSGNVRIWQAAPLSQETVAALYQTQFTKNEEVVWDSREQAVAARKRVSFGAFIIEETPLRNGDASLADRMAQAVLSGIRELGMSCLPWTEELYQWRLRVELLRAVDKGGDWPDVSEEALLTGLEDWLVPFLQGISRRSQFSKIDLAAALHALLPWRKQRELDAMAPTHMEVPSGSFIRLLYEASAEGIVPVLAVKLQEMFGMQESPAIAEGKVPVLVHLLSPAGRPLQITRDLKGFWKNGYPAVRAEMRGRYPKHPWPEDPFAALPTRLTNRRLQNRS